MNIPSAELARIRDLYHQGRYRQALAAGAEFGPVRNWEGPAGRLMAGRLAVQLGAPRLGRRLHLVAVRQSPTYLEAVYYHARYQLEHFGPLACWRYVQNHTDWSDAAPDLRADWLAVQALAAARVRDFDRADRLLNQADTIAPDRPWLLVERASVLELADKSDEALDAARRALDRQAWFRPGVQAYAHILQRAGRFTETIDFLTEAASHLESGAIVGQLAGLYFDRNEPAKAAAALDQFVELSPLMEPEVAKWLAARRADVAYYLGDPTAAAAAANQVGDDFYTAFATALQSPPSAGPARTLLALDLTATSIQTSGQDLAVRFWQAAKLPDDADGPTTFDGLPDAADRRRFEAAGWTTREFQLTIAAAVELLNRGVPFLLTLVEAGFGQPRLVIGVDPVRNSLFLADPSEHRAAEAPIAILQKRYGAFGPRCLAVVPPGESARLEELDLPDAAVYDRLYAGQLALLDRDFAAAKTRFDELRTAFPGHRLGKFAAIAWARATAHPVLLLDALNDLLADHPHEPTLILSKAAVLRDLGRMPERLELLRAEGTSGTAEPLLTQSLAQMLLPNPNERFEADRLLRRSLRVRPMAAAGYFLLASQRWEEQDFATAVEWYRMAACLDDREEQFAEAYARAARVTGQAPEPLRLFQQRATRTAIPHPAAVRSLYFALVDRDEPAQAVGMLGKAIEKLTAAGDAGHGALAEVLLFRAEMHANNGRYDAAAADLTAAQPVAPAGAWHKAAARVARLRPDFAATLTHLEALRTLEPLSADAHRLTAGLLADTRGRAAARDYLDLVAARYPDVYPLVKLRAEFVYGDPDDAAVRATRELVALCSHDAWALRQLALVYADRKRHDDALDAITRAADTEPEHPSHAAVLAHVHRRADRIDDALDAFRDGVRRLPDHELAVFELVQLSRGIKEKRAALRFISDRLHDYPHTGDGLLAYFDQAQRYIDDPEDLEEFVADLERFLDERPDLWQAWSVVCQAMVMSQRESEAVSLAKEATERFPLVSRVWIDLAEACRAAEQSDERIEALKEAVLAAPNWVPAVRELADALNEAGNDDEAVAVLERVVPRAPADPLARWFLAERLWQAGRGRDAFDAAKIAVRLDTGFDPRAEIAWNAVMAWADRVDAPDEPADLARDLCKDRAGDPRAWLRLARCLTEPEQTPEVLAALDTAIRLDPRNVEAFDMKAERLAAVGRFDDALAAARPPSLVIDLPIVLQGRAAWIEARRGNYAAAIPPMQALVAVDPEYVWGWQQLADWYNETGRPENYLEAASELVRLRPEHPMSLTMRGEAKLQTGDRDGGKSDLRDALRIHPGYSAAAVILFDACLADNEHREARTALAVLQEHLTGTEVLVKQLQFAARTADMDGATRAFGELCKTPGGGPPLYLQMGFAEMATAGWEEAAVDLLREAWESGDEFNPWAAIYWLDTPDGEASDDEVRLAACEAVVAAYPKFVSGHDRRAEHLALLGRFDEAAVACMPPSLGLPPPLPLRGRAAWVDAERGDRGKAVERMKQLLADDPDYAWGWRQLAQWSDALGRTREYLDAADQVVRLTPEDAIAHAIRGEARRALGDHRGARDDFRRAFDLDPGLEAAGLQLISAQLATDDVAGAATTLTAVRDLTDGPLVSLRGVQVAARQGNLAAARSAFAELTTSQRTTPGILRDAVSAFAAAGWEAEADEELTAAVMTIDDGTAVAAGLWVERTFAHGKPGAAADGLTKIIDRNRVAGREAVLTYAEAIAGPDPAGTAATIQRYSELLRGDDDAWARAGGALVTARNYALAAAWLNDWKDRPDCEPWMLKPLAAALRALDRDTEADAVAKAMIAVGPPDETPADFPAWLAVVAAARGAADEAEGYLVLIDPLGQPDGVKLLVAAAEAVLMVLRAGPSGKRAAFAEAKDHLTTAAGACAPADVPPGAARWICACINRIAADTGTLGARFWATWLRISPLVKGN